MISWWIGTLFGTITLLILNTFQRSHGFSGPNAVLVGLLAVICAMGFWYGFYHTDNFVLCWFLGTGLLSVFAMLIDILWFGGQVFFWKIIGVLLIATGLFILGNVK